MEEHDGAMVGHKKLLSVLFKVMKRFEEKSLSEVKRTYSLQCQDCGMHYDPMYSGDGEYVVLDCYKKEYLCKRMWWNTTIYDFICLRCGTWQKNTFKELR